jgi:lipopolysaccharide/colanic/teichoic acid biosynthesis glycosyltransferase
MVVRNASPAVARRQRRPLQSGYVQLVVVATLAVLAPLLLPFAASHEYLAYLARLDTTRNTQVASLVAAVAALIGIRRVTAYPGTQAFAAILPAFLAMYGVAAMVLLVGRFAYSGAGLTAGLLFSTTAMFVLVFLSQRGAPMQFFIVPGSEAGIVPDTPRVRWLRLTEPRVPVQTDAAIVADLHADYDPEWERMLALAAINGRPVYHTKQLHESLTGRVQIEHLSENNFGSLLPNLAYFEIKRLIDIVAVVLLAPLLALPMLAVALAIRLDSPGPALFRQIRMGYRERPFAVVKFRTMHHRAADDAHDPVTRDGDDRVTRIGRFLRRSRIDELPQLWNVIKGEMSLIGPRPEATALSEWYERELPFYAYRHIVRPGITGWAQINQGHVAALDEVHLKLQYDFYYIKNFSAWIDILIAMRTVVIMLNGFGSR